MMQFEIKTWAFIVLILIGIPFKSNAQNNNRQNLRFIAHRGGVVSKEHGENSIGALKEAIRQGYWMVEIDLRRSADGKIIVNHNPTFKKYYNNPNRVSNMSWSEIRQLTSKLDGSHPMIFKRVAILAKGNIRLMLDIKRNDYPEQFYERINKILKKNKLLSTTFILNGSQAASYFSKRSPLITISYKELLKKAKAGVDVSKRFYLFALPDDITKEEVQTANKLGVIYVAAINEFRYNQYKIPWQRAKKDIKQLLVYGIKYFQIDGKYMANIWLYSIN